MRNKRVRHAQSAVALNYNGKGAPSISAKGKGDIAGRILEIARANDVPIQKDPTLTAALSEIPLGDQVPEALFRAVAEVLAYVYAISDKALPGHEGMEGPPKNRKSKSV